MSWRMNKKVEFLIIILGINSDSFNCEQEEYLAAWNN